MRALDRNSRLGLAACAFAALVAAYVTTPYAARSASAPAAAAAAPARAPEAPQGLAVIAPRRDPFAGGTPSSPVALPRADDVRIPAGIGPLPPNLGAAGFPALPQTQPRVTAVVTGRRPYALVDDAGRARIITNGDEVGTSVVAEIRPDGVRLASGTLLRLTPGVK